MAISPRLAMRTRRIFRPVSSWRDMLELTSGANESEASGSEITISGSLLVLSRTRCLLCTFFRQPA
jgi:hypothetical protein